MNNYKISCVMTTYRRFTCVERSIAMFLNQDCKEDKELIIFNTDDEYPLIIGDSLKQHANIIVINNNIDYITKKPYDNVGSIRRDAITHATGTHYICWDDDDIFLPWNNRQCMDGIQRFPEAWAWKPEKSSFWNSESKIEITGNAMEASIISRLDKIKEYGFREHKGGGEHWSWLQVFMDYRKIVHDYNSVPGYCFNWSDQGTIRGHKQSGTLDHPDNFNIHKQGTKDVAVRPLETYSVNTLNAIYIKFIILIKNNVDKPIDNYNISQSNYNAYVQPYEYLLNT